MVRKARDKVVTAIAPRYVSLPDASVYTGYATRTLRQYITEGRLKGYRATDNGDLRIKVEDLDALLGA
jgi:predicted site-specific integrase-resolvase